MSTFDPAQHPRATTGQFAEKSNTAPTKPLSIFERHREAERQAAADVRESAKQYLPGAATLVFETNYTDEGSALTLSGQYDVAGNFTNLDLWDETGELTTDQLYGIEQINDSVFEQSGGGEDGSQIPGMQLKDGTNDVYLFDVAS